MPSSAKDIISKLKEEKKRTKKTNVTLSLDENLYETAQIYLKKQGLMLSKVVEEFLRDMLGR